MHFWAVASLTTRRSPVEVVDMHRPYILLSSLSEGIYFPGRGARFSSIRRELLTIAGIDAIKDGVISTKKLQCRRLLM
jgi:hypothetical protein